MKFAHEFREALEREGFPARWVEAAVPYGQLKKCLKKVQRELESFGLDPGTLAQLSAQKPGKDEDLRRGSDTGFQYHLDGGSTIVPKLTIFVQLEDGVAVDAALSPDTRAYLSALAVKQHGERTKSIDSDVSSGAGGVETPEKEAERLGTQRVEVPLTFDAEFFDILYDDVTTLDKLQQQEQTAMAGEIEALSTCVRAITKPSKVHKTDMNRWRELFDIYLQAGIFFSTHELDHGQRDSTIAARQLQWFQGEVTKRGLVEKFKLPSSHQALQRFVQINISLLQTLKFQEINQRAISKILKKFDKRTHLGATRAFPKLIQSDAIMSGTMAKAVCSQVSQDLLQIVPQLEEYECPVCTSILWRPIRLKCGHLLCIRCTILLQRKRKGKCPMCRENVILEADQDNIDEQLSKFLKKNFPKEVRAKQIYLETEDGRERWGIDYKHPSEESCRIM